jgi:hypothetical protein
MIYIVYNYIRTIFWPEFASDTEKRRISANRIMKFCRHEAFCFLWHAGPQRLQGLIQVAVAFHHDNVLSLPKGAQRSLTPARKQR